MKRRSPGLEITRLLGFVVPTVGRWSALSSLLDSLATAASPEQPVEVVVVVQGGPAPVDPPRSSRGVRLTVVTDAGRGASRARNLGLAHLSPEVSHVVWPNDHSRYTAASLAALRRHLDRDVVVGRLVEQGVDRYDVASSEDPIDAGNVWDAIEPATAISTRLLRGEDGWAEWLGTGADSPWQSSALADLLLVLAPDATVAWEPEFLVHGDGFTRGATGAELNAKLRSYGRGYGRVLSSWRYPVRRRVGCVVKPLVQRGYRVGPDVLPLPARIAAAVGRAEGIVGHLLPGASRAPRRPSDLTLH